MHFQPLLILSLVLTALTAPLATKKGKAKEPEVITLDLDDGDIHYPNGTTVKQDGTFINGPATVPIPRYPHSGYVCETHPLVEDPLFNLRAWKQECKPRMF